MGLPKPEKKTQRDLLMSWFSAFLVTSQLRHYNSAETKFKPTE